MAEGDHDTTLQKWPVILNESLCDKTLFKLLENQHKLRVSSSTLTDTVIFPMSGVIFMLFDAYCNDCLHSSDLQSPPLKKLLCRIKKMLVQHRNCYLFFMAPMCKENELQLFEAIQNRFLFSQFHMLPVHSHPETVECMLNIAKALYKPVSNKLLTRLDGLLQGPWCEAQRIEALKTTGISEHECSTLLDVLGSLQGIAEADHGTLLNCGLAKESCEKILSFFTTTDQQESS